MLVAGAVLLAIVVLALSVVLRVRRRSARVEERVRLYEMMRLRGVSAPAPENAAAAQDVAAAERRCAACASKAQCDELLRAGDTKGFRQFCPNALYVEYLRSNSLDFE